VYVAIRDAFAAAVRQLEDYVRRQRGDQRSHEVFPREVWGDRHHRLVDGQSPSRAKSSGSGPNVE
jgi:hypothetical protein